MKNSTINLFFIIQTIIVFLVIWFKTDVWWYGLLGGFIVHPALCGLVEGVTRPKLSLMYPRYFYISTVFIVLYYFVL